MDGKENCKDTTNHLDTTLPSNGLKKYTTGKMHRTKFNHMEYLKKPVPTQEISLFFWGIKGCLVLYSALVSTICLARRFF